MIVGIEHQADPVALVDGQVVGEKLPACMVRTNCLAPSGVMRAGDGTDAHPASTLMAISHISRIDRLRIACSSPKTSKEAILHLELKAEFGAGQDSA